MDARQLQRWELDGVDGPVVFIDVIRAFTTVGFDVPNSPVAVSRTDLDGGRPYSGPLQVPRV